MSAIPRPQPLNEEYLSRTRAPHTRAYGCPALAAGVNPRLPCRATRNGARGATGARQALLIRCMAGLLCCVGFSAPCVSQQPNEVHGSGDAYAASGIVLAWGVLRGADDAATRVVLRIVADASVYPIVTAVARNPFSNAERALLSSTSTAGPVDVRVPRSQYADFPRSEVRFYGSSAAAQANTPTLVVFYLGVPDTTPEFTNEAALQAYFAERIARARAAAGKTP